MFRTKVHPDPIAALNLKVKVIGQSSRLKMNESRLSRMNSRASRQTCCKQRWTLSVKHLSRTKLTHLRRSTCSGDRAEKLAKFKFGTMFQRENPVLELPKFLLNTCDNQRVASVPRTRWNGRSIQPLIPIEHRLVTDRQTDR